MSCVHEFSLRMHTLVSNRPACGRTLSRPPAAGYMLPAAQSRRHRVGEKFQVRYQQKNETPGLDAQGRAGAESRAPASNGAWGEVHGCHAARRLPGCVRNPKLFCKASMHEKIA